MKKIITNSLLLFLLSIFISFVYKVLPYFITLTFSPVNNSIFEYLKLIFSSYIIFLILKLVFLKTREANDIKNHFYLGLFNIAIFLILYLPVILIFKENIFLAYIINFISISITMFLYQKLEKKQNNSKENNLFIIPIVLLFIMFTYFSYHPLKNFLFFDKQNNKYGIHTNY